MIEERKRVEGEIGRKEGQKKYKERKERERGGIKKDIQSVLLASFGYFITEDSELTWNIVNPIYPDEVIALEMILDKLVMKVIAGYTSWMRRDRKYMEAVLQYFSEAVYTQLINTFRNPIFSLVLEISFYCV